MLNWWTFSPPVTIWAVRHNHDVYDRSVNGPSATWYRAVGRDTTIRLAPADRD